MTSASVLIDCYSIVDSKSFIYLLLSSLQLDKNFKGFLEKTIKLFYKGAEFDDGEIDALKEAGKPISASWDFAQVYVSVN